MLLLDSMLSVIAPHGCLGCDAEGSLFCFECSENIARIPERCYVCMRLTRNSTACSGCRSSSSLRSVWVRTVYGGDAQALITRLKFGRAIAAAPLIAEFMADALPYYAKDTIVTHMPTATTRMRQRGYDQSQQIAKFLARLMGCTYTSLLFRQGSARQVGSSRRERIRHMEAAYVPRHAPRVRGATVLLVDDVLTTGASMEAAARAIRNMGARHVDAAIFAQKQ